MTVRGARLGDADALARVECASWLAAYSGILRPSWLAEFHDHGARSAAWTARIEGGSVIRVVEHHGRVVGYCSYGPPNPTVHRDLEEGFAAEIYELYVDPQLQGQGLGRRLVHDVFARLRAQNIGWVILEVLKDNAPARAFYERIGMLTEGHERRRDRREWRRLGRRYSKSLNTVAVVRYEYGLLDDPLKWLE